MCFQVTERYSACKCIYYQHPVDRCPTYGRSGHEILKRTILVGYSCAEHANALPKLASRKPIASTIRETGFYSHTKPPSSKGRNKPTFSNEAITPNKAATQSPAARVETVQNQSHKQCKSDDLEDFWPESEGNSTLKDDDASASYSSGVLAGSTSFTVPSEVENSIAALFKDLLEDSSLRYLWPQIIRLAPRNSLAERNIARLLRRFSDDLIKRANTTTEMDASKFIRFCRHRLARQIVEEYGTAGTEEDVQNGLESRELEYQDGGQIKEQENAEDIEPEVSYELMRDFLFTGPSFESFEKNVKLFVTKQQQQQPQATSNLSTTTAAVQVYVFNTYNQISSLLFRNEVPPSKKRIYWTCVSSQELAVFSSTLRSHLVANSMTVLRSKTA
jgi:hypothetical protein